MQKGSVQILLIIVALIVLGVGGVYFYQNSKSSNLLQSPQLTISKEAEFKEYSNQQLGFSFKYSQDFTVKIDSEEEFNQRAAGSASKSVNGDFRKNFTSYVTYPPADVSGAVVILDNTASFEMNPFTVWVFENPDDLTIDKWYLNFWYYPFVWGDYTARRNEVAPTNEASVSGQISKSGVVDYQPGKPKFVYINYQGKMYLFSIIGENGDKILQSFKFLNQTNETANPNSIGANWKTYTNDKLNFSFKYPPEWPLKEEQYEDRYTISLIAPDYGNKDYRKIQLNIFQKDTTLQIEKSNLLKNNIEVKDIIINIPDSVPAIQFSGVVGTADGYEVEFIISNSLYSFMISTAGPDIEESKPLLDTIISTFKFTDKPSSSKVCAQVITPAKNIQTGQCQTFTTSCLPEGWVVDRINCKIEI